MGLHLDPTQELIIDFFNPGLAVNINVSGIWLKDGKPEYFSAIINVPTYVGIPTQYVFSVYYDELISITAWRPIAPAGTFSMFAHAYIRQGGAQTNLRVMNLFSGWISDGNPAGYPNIDRTDKGDCLAGNFQVACVVAPAPACTFTPVAGMPVKITGFNGTFTAAGPAGNRFIGLGIDDGAGVIFQGNYNLTAWPALSVVNVFGMSPGAIQVTSGNDCGVPLPDYIIRDPELFTANILGALAGDVWANSIVVYRPYFDF